ncbi:MAG: LapA family protein [Gammaproteobacteria bacterium]|nr:LapA family protein [Gammaproteobacteria bacterium]
MKLRLILTLVLLLIVGIFMVQNAALVEIRFLFWQFGISRSLLVMLMLLIGVVIGWFTRAMYRIARSSSS